MRPRIRSYLPAGVGLVLLNLLWLGPVYLIVVNAATPSTEYDPSRMLTPPASVGALLDNLQIAVERTDLFSNLAVTVLYSLAAPLFSTLVGALAGYGIVALRLRHGFVWFMVIFGASIIPFQMVLVPVFLGYAVTGLYNTQLGLILIYTVLGVPFAAFVMRNFFVGIADTVFEAATLDGAPRWRIFASVYLPMAVPALVAIFILQFTSTWNDLLLGITLSWSPEVRPVMPALATLQTSTGGGSLPVQLAASLLVSIPTVLIFFASQRFFRRGIALGQVGQ